MNDIVILGRPRSGNNWVRYICQQLLPDKKVIKSHFFDNDDYSKETKLIVVIRDYKECLMRHLSVYNNKKEFCVFRDGLLGEEHQNTEEYLWYLHIYEKCSLPKTLIYYEDLIQDPINEIRRMNGLVFGNNELCKEFIENYDYHFEQSLKEYTDTGNLSMTRGKNIIHHKNFLPQEDRYKWDEELHKRDPYLYETYLERYREDG